MVKLIPAISDVCQYLIFASDMYNEAWDKLGSEALALMQTELFKSNESFQSIEPLCKKTRMDHSPQDYSVRPSKSCGTF